MESPQPKTTPLIDLPELESDKQTDELLGATFDNELFVGGVEHSDMSRRQNTSNQQKYAKQKLKHPLEISAEELQKLQEDPTLRAIHKAMRGDISSWFL